MNRLLFLLLCLATPCIAQPARTFVLGDRLRTWESGGRGMDAQVIVRTFPATIDTTNTPGDAIDFFAVPFTHPETKLDVYVLDLVPSGVTPLRIPEIVGAPAISTAVVGASPHEIEFSAQDIPATAQPELALVLAV